MTEVVLGLMMPAFVTAGVAEFPYVGINAGAPIWGGAIYFDATKASAIAATGCRTVRINFRLDGNASWNPTLLAKYDTIIQNAISRNIDVVGLLCNEIMPVGQTAWNDDPDGDGMNSYVTGFSATAYTIIDRYRDRVKRFEIWNEPDAWTNPDYASDPKNAGGTYMLPRVYAHLLAETYLQCNYYDGRRILSDSGVSLCAGGVFAHDIGGANPKRYFAYQYMGDVYAEDVWNWMQSNAGRRYPWDYFGYHFYLSPGATFDSSELAQYLDRMKSRKTANSDGSPFLITEFGWNSLSVSEAVQAANLRDAYNYLETRPDVAGAYWYQWQDEPGASYGIVRGDNSHKPAYDEFVALADVPPPIAEFTAAPTSGNPPLVIQFTDRSTGGPITSWLWSFGDSGTSSEQNPSHTYRSPGRYTVTLTVSGPTGTADAIGTGLIAVWAPVPEDFDQDLDVDLTDFTFLQSCFNGPNRPLPFAACSIADLDGDNDVDLADFGTFQACFNGPNRPPACE
jgi:hypothetical protein